MKVRFAHIRSTRSFLTCEWTGSSVVVHASTSVFDNAVSNLLHLLIFRSAGPEHKTADGGDFIIEDVV